MATQAYSAFAEMRMSDPQSDTATVLDLDHVQAALLFHGPRPAPGALVVAGGHRLRTRAAADARIALIVEWIIRNLVTEDEVPHVRFRPPQQRIDFHQP